MSPTNALLYVSTERVLYRGALGQPREREFSASAWYVAVGGDLVVTGPSGDVWRADGAVQVSAGTRHLVEAHCGQVLCYLAEAEFGDGLGVACVRRAAWQPSSRELAALATLDLGWMRTLRDDRCSIDAEMDRLVLGEVLPRRDIDGRIADVVGRVRSDPTLAWQAADAAAHCGLSPSRFMHLFKAEMGMGWRDFRAWTRARAMLARVQSGNNLTQLALSLGYPDGTHFSHAIRQITGLTPSDIVVGSRNLSVWNDSGVSPA
jgi:AraC-like DNA-binding protein